jgi:tubulin delta
VVYFQNDRVYRVLSRANVAATEKVINMRSMNEYIASAFGNYLVLHENEQSNSFYFDSLNNLTPLPSLKYLQCISAPYLFEGGFHIGNESTWENIIGSANSQIKTGMEIQSNSIRGYEEEKNGFMGGEPSKGESPGLKKYFGASRDELKALAASVLLSSSKIDVVSGQAKSKNFKSMIKSGLSKSLKGCDWNPDWMQIEHITQKKLDKYFPEKNLTMLYNCNETGDLLSYLLKKAEYKYKSRAYLHWFWKFGLDNSYFEEAFQSLANVVSDYKEI